MSDSESEDNDAPKKDKVNITKLKNKESWNLFVEDVIMALMEKQKLHILFPDHDAVMPGEAAITRWCNNSKYADGVKLAMNARSSKTVVNLTTGRIHLPRNVKSEPKDGVKSEKIAPSITESSSKIGALLVKAKKIQNHFKDSRRIYGWLWQHLSQSAMK